MSGIFSRSIIGDVKGDTRSLDYSSCSAFLACDLLATGGTPAIPRPSRCC